MDFLPLWCLMPILGLTAWCDLTRMRIPNVLVLAGFAIFVATAPFLNMDEMLSRLMVGAITLVVCFTLFTVNVIGAGDAKMMSVIMLFVPSEFLTFYMFGFSLAMCAGMLGVFLARREFGSEAATWVSMRPKAHFPMGVSIALSGLLLAVSPNMSNLF